MLEPTRRVLTEGRVILASGSPTRRNLLTRLGINAEIIPSGYKEDLDRANYPNHGEYVRDLACHKVMQVFDRVKNDPVPPKLVIGADTVVTIGETIFGKPKDKADALRMLTCLANREHEVFTGVCIKTPDREVKFYDSARVKIGDICEEQIRAYVDTEEPLGKAGAYGIQGQGGILVERVEGDFFTVVGIPLFKTFQHLNQIFSTDR